MYKLADKNKQSIYRYSYCVLIVNGYGNLVELYATISRLRAEVAFELPGVLYPCSVAVALNRVETSGNEPAPLIIIAVGNVL